MRSRKTSSAPPGGSQARGFRQWWLNKSLRVKGLIVIAIPLVALFGTISASLLLQQSERHERSAAQTVRQLTSAANLFLADMVNGETSIRGYSAVRDPVYLGPYNLMLTRIGAERNSLREAAAAAGDSRQQRAVDATAGTVLREFAHMRSVIGRAGSVWNLSLLMEQQKTTMDLLRRQTTGLSAGPTARAAVLLRKVDSLVTTIGLVDVAGLALGLLGGLAGIALFTSGVARRVGMNAVNAGRLGAGQPLEPAAKAGDEIGQLSDSLIRAEELLATRGAELATAMDTALRATQAKNSFLSSTSHELRTPLNSILGFTQLLQMSELSEEDSDSVGRILGAGRHLLMLINELIDIARIESGDLSLSLEPVLVSSVIEETSQLMAPIAAGRSIRITQHCAHPGLAVHADRQRLSQVLVNLISNAIKYNHRDGTVTVSCQEEGTGQASIAVSDTGPGISPDNLERIFIPFERLGAEQTAVEGTGIGLPLAKALTEAMHGQLTASSVPGQGSAFTISLPRVPDLLHVPALFRAPPSSAARPPAPAGASLSILYIEDNPANIEVVARFLRGRPNTRLQSEASGRAGLEHAARETPDLILLDLHLPDLHGEQVLNELKAELPTAAIPVVVLSADASPGVIRRLLADGAFAYLTKPIELAELAGLLDTFAAAQAQDQLAPPAIRATLA